jgi:hypothetical protein
MTLFPPANYLRDGGRTETEMKDAFENWLATTKQMPGGAAQSTLVINTDQITPTGAYHLVDTQAAAAADNLAQILPTNLPDGSMLMLSIVSNTRVVVVKHAAGGTGQISLVAGVDFTIAFTTSFLLLQRNGNVWEERGRWYGTDGAAHRAFYGVPGLATENVFTKRQSWNKGANLTAASTLTLGTDGNYFHVLGNTTINALSTMQAGARVLLVFEGTLVLVHNATILILPGAMNITAKPGDMYEFLSEGSGNWRLLGAAGAGGSVLGRYANVQTVTNTVAETFLAALTVPGGTLQLDRRARLEVQLAIADNAPAVAQHGLTFFLYYGGALAARMFFVTSENSDGIGSGQHGYLLTGMVSGRANPAFQVANLAIDGPKKFVAGAVGVIGAAIIENTGVYPAIGFPTVNTAIDQTLQLNCKWSAAAPQKICEMYHAILRAE